MEAYDPNTVFSSIDSWGRYAYANQPAAAGWNLARFAETLLPLIDDDTERAIELAQAALGSFADRYETARLGGMRAKLGLTADVDDEAVTALAGDLLDLLHTSHVDYTSIFVDLGRAARGDAEPVRGLFIDLAGFDGWLTRWRALAPDAAVMDRANPIYLPRNHLLEEALAAATAGGLEPIRRLLVAIAEPYTERPWPGALPRARPRGLRAIPHLLRDLSR